MKKLLILASLILCVNFYVKAQEILFDEIIHTFTQDSIVQILEDEGIPSIVSILSPQNYAVELHKIIYTTIDAKGLPTQASGIITLPVIDDPSFCAPMLTYMHGTIFDKQSVPSNLEGAEWIVALVNSSYGYVSLLPDYIGMGESPGFHPYVHAGSEASCALDMMRATQTLCDERGVSLNEQVFITGYSQGGHGAMALHKEIQTNHSDEFTVTACAPLSGPYDVSGVQTDAMLSDINPSRPGYLMYIIIAYKDIYREQYNLDTLTYDEIFVEPYNTLAPQVENWSISSGDISYPALPRDMLTENILNQFNSNPNFPMRLALAENDVYDFTPQAPIRLGFCPADTDVAPANATVAQEYFEGLGFMESEVWNYDVNDEDLPHTECAIPSILYTRLWFDGFADFVSCSTPTIDFNKMTNLSIMPNPLAESSIVNVSTNHFKDFKLELYNLSGQLVRTEIFSGNKHVLYRNNLLSGMYILKLHNSNGAVLASEKLIVH